MTYRWQRLHGRPTDLPSRDLTAEDVPPAPTSIDDGEAIDLMIEFAHTFNGYRWGGAVDRLGEVYDETLSAWHESGELPASPDRIRACLFYWARADRHGGAYGPESGDLAWLGALLDGLRDRVSD